MVPAPRFDLFSVEVIKEWSKFEGFFLLLERLFLPNTPHADRNLVESEVVIRGMISTKNQATMP